MPVFRTLHDMPYLKNNLWHEPRRQCQGQDLPAAY